MTQLNHPNGKTISSTYDTLNRLTGVTFGGGETFSYSYDALGRTTGATDQHGTKSISYDAASRVTSSTDPFGDQTSLSYDDDDRVTSVTTPLGATSTTYDNDSRPTQINIASGGQINNTFDNAARLTHSDLPNGVDLDFTYNNANNPTNKTYSLPDPFFNNGPKVQTSKPKDPDSLFVTIGKQAQFLHNKLGPNPTFGDICTLLLDQKFYGTLRTLPVIVASFSYTYDANKNISQRSYPNGIQNFTYDNYDRLTQATASEGTYTYTYDVRNNRSTMRFVNYNQTVDQTTTYTYSIDDRLTSYTVVNNLNQQTIRTVNYTYDDAGNTLTKAVTEGGTTLTTTYTYYDDNRLKTTTLPSSEVITYTYHADGTRATKTNATEWIRYHYSGGLVKEVHCDKNNHSTIFFTIHYQPGRIIYQPNQGNNVYYYTASDCSGTIYKLLNDQGQIVASYNYDPFGVLIENTNPSIYMPIGYSGTYRDTETGLLFAQSRYYDPSIGRFTTKDSYRGELVSQISQNRYIYCHQNPISYFDPSGFAPENTTDVKSKHNSSKAVNLETDKTSAESKGNNPPPVTNGMDKLKADAIRRMGKDLEPGQTKPFGNGYIANIGGHIIYISKDGGGNITVESMDGSGEGSEIARGIEDAFRQIPESLRKVTFANAGRMANFVSYMNDKLSDKNRTYEIQSLVGAAYTMSKNAFCTAIGYFAAVWIRSGVYRDSDLIFDPLLTDLYEKGATDESSFDFMADTGFWNAWFNSSDSSYHHTLDMPFDLRTHNSWSDRASFCDIVRTQLTYSIGAAYGEGVRTSLFSLTDALKSIKDCISTVLELGTALAEGALGIFTAIIDTMVSARGGSGYVSTIGATSTMANISDKQNKTKDQTLFGAYYIDRTFIGIGVISAYMKCEFDNLLNNVSVNPTYLQMGDLFLTFTFMNDNLKAAVQSNIGTAQSMKNYIGDFGKYTFGNTSLASLDKFYAYTDKRYKCLDKNGKHILPTRLMWGA